MIDCPLIDHVRLKGIHNNIPVEELYLFEVVPELLYGVPNTSYITGTVIKQCNFSSGLVPHESLPPRGPAPVRGAPRQSVDISAS